jgi:lipopolysaccharide assembly protein A
MRWVYLTIVVLVVAAILIFALQNLGVATMSFLGFSIRAPLAILAVIIYVLGAFTGGSLFALLRHSMKGSRAGGR